MSDTEFAQLLSAAGRLLQEIDDYARHIVDDCRRVLRLLGPAGAALDGLAARVESAASDAVRQVQPLLERPGDPVALAVAGVRWNLQVAQPVRRRVETFTADFATADDHWRGAAAETYLATLPPQHAAMAEMQDVVSAFGASLEVSGAALLTFWSAAVPALASGVAELVPAVALTGNPLTAPAGAAAALVAIEGCIAVINGLFGALCEVLAAQAQAQARLQARLGDPALFPSGHWPMAAAASLSDASLSDGDASDWTLRR